MQDNTRDTHDAHDGTASAPPAATSSAIAANTGPTAAPQNASYPASPPQPARHRSSIHPLWLAAGVVVLFGLVFGARALPGANAATVSAPSGNTIEQTTINVIQAVDPSVVQVQARGLFGTAGGVGSGVILTKNGYIVTNDHVVHGLSRFTVLLANGQDISAQLVGEAPTEDLAVLKVSENNLKPIAISNPSQIQVGVYALALGSPLGLEQSATSGIISALNRQANAVIGGQAITLTGLIQTSAPINPGNSGGALVNLQGQLIGIPTLGAVDPTTGVAANGIGFAIAASRMQTIVHHFIGSAG